MELTTVVQGKLRTTTGTLKGKPITKFSANYCVFLRILQETHHEMRIPERDVTYIVLYAYLRLSTDIH